MTFPTSLNKPRDPAMVAALRRISAMQDKIATQRREIERLRRLLREVGAKAEAEVENLHNAADDKVYNDARD